MKRRVAIAAGAGLLCAISAEIVMAQTPDYLSTDATLGRVVRGQPLSADGVTTMSQVLADGTRIERSAPSKFFRDSEGRVRREQTILGLTALQSLAQAQRVTTIMDSVAGVTYLLQPGQKVAQRARIDNIDRSRLIYFRTYFEYLAQRPGAFRDPNSTEITQGFRIPLKFLGARNIDGLAATGRQTVRTIDRGEIGNDRPIVIVEERWESEELGLLVESRHEDPRTGTVQFRLTNIQRSEPPRELFEVPPD